MNSLRTVLGAPVKDPEEEAFVVFSQSIPSSSLGFIDSQAAEVTITIGSRVLSIRQSRGLLTSDRQQGTTGAGLHPSHCCSALVVAALGAGSGSLTWTAVAWKVTPHFAKWIASSPNFLFSDGYLGAESVALELGAGVSGVVALALAPKIRRYIASDQDYVLRLLKQNIADNLPPVTNGTSKKQKTKKKANHAAADTSANIDTLELDWELSSVSSLPAVLGLDHQAICETSGVDLIIACDCIYNESLIEPLNNTCAQICELRAATQQSKPTLCLVAQQLRSHDVFESWLKSFHRLFHVWQVPDELLTEPLRQNSGFIVHIGVVRSSP